jgi:tetratricopeptide (TPR) repeat protein
MDIDIYQQCPCHAEKKIKFCCGKDVVGDLNDVLAKNKSGQSKAALDQLERVMQKSGPKDCLLTIQTHILITTGEIEKARESNELFLKTNPKHSTGLHHRALIELAEGQTDKAVASLQDAMDSITGNEIPLSLANAFRMVGVGLFSEGKSIAARAHLKYAMALKGDSDPELGRMLHESLVSQSTPLVLKQDFPLAPSPADVEWEKRYVNVFRALDRGQFRKALKFLNKIDSEHPDLPIIVRGIAVVNAYLGRQPEMVAAWRRYSHLDDVSKLEAAEAEAIAQLFDDGPLIAPVSIERITFELTEIEAVSEFAISNPRFAPSQSIDADPFDEGPAPRMTFLVLDRPKVSSADELTLENVPNVIAEILIYSKQTDRPARIEAITAKDDRHDEMMSLLNETFQEFIEGEPKRQSIGESNAMSELLEWRWHLPEGVSRQAHAEMVKTHREHLLLEEWPKLEFSILNDQSPEAASQDPEMEIPLRALILMLENASQGQVFNDELGDKIRARLGLSNYEEVQPGENQLLSSPILQQCLDYKSLSESQLNAVRNDAMTVGNMRVLKKVVAEALDRPESDSMTRDACYSMMAHFTDDDDQSLEFLEKAKEEGLKAGRPVGIYFVQEFEFRLTRGLTDQLPELLQTIQMNYINDPDVEYQLVRVLDRFGIGPDRGPIRGGPPAEGVPSEAAQPSGGIWTPGSQAATPVVADAAAGEASAPEAEDSPSGLWIPE